MASLLQAHSAGVGARRVNRMTTAKRRQLRRAPRKNRARGVARKLRSTVPPQLAELDLALRVMTDVQAILDGQRRVRSYVAVIEAVPHLDPCHVYHACEEFEALAAVSRRFRRRQK
jgi:hypothetical protein